MNPAYLFIVIFSFPFFLFSQSQTDNRYKWQNSDAIIEIINGKTDQAIDYFQQFLKTHPGDLESYYGLALAYTQKQD
ncbi:MAG: tetratricopeptide repeat protein, partial [Bacteroidetes bacterium]|nr:tetratricopeptide repeat protein [Bacteroidota bacterium]